MVEAQISTELKKGLINYIRSGDSKLSIFRSMVESGLITEDIMMNLGNMIPYYRTWGEVCNVVGDPRTTEDDIKFAISYYMKFELGWDRLIKGRINFDDLYKVLSFEYDSVLAYVVYSNSKGHYQKLNSFKGIPPIRLATSLLTMYNLGASYVLDGVDYPGKYRTIVEFERDIYI